MNHLPAFVVMMSLPVLAGEQAAGAGQQPNADESVTLQDFPPRPQYVWRTIAWSPDGTRLALSVPGPVGKPGLVRIWDITSGKIVASKDEIKSFAVSLAWSPDGERLAGVSPNPHGPVTVWNIKTGKEEFSLTAGRWAYLRRVAWSPDGDQLAVSAGAGIDTPRKLHIWNLRSKELTTLDLSIVESGLRIDSMAWSLDRTQLATGHVTGAVKIRSPSGTVEATLLGHSGTVQFVAWSPDGKRLASATVKEIKIWDIPARREVATIDVEAWQFPCLAWSPDGTRLVSGANDHSVRMWDVNTGQLAGRPRMHTEPVWAVVWLPNRNRIASLSADGIVQTWELGPMR